MEKIVESQENKLERKSADQINFKLCLKPKSQICHFSTKQEKSVDEFNLAKHVCTECVWAVKPIF